MSRRNYIMPVIFFPSKTKITKKKKQFHFVCIVNRGEMRLTTNKSRAENRRNVFYYIISVILYLTNVNFEKNEN